MKPDEENKEVFERCIKRLQKFVRPSDVGQSFSPTWPECCHLGIIAQEQRDFEGADAWYRKSLAIKEKQGDEQAW